MTYRPVASTTRFASPGLLSPLPTAAMRSPRMATSAFSCPVALTTETYNYRIETEKGEIVERRGVATSVLKKVGRDWKILSTHGSSRKPKVS